MIRLRFAAATLALVAMTAGCAHMNSYRLLQAERQSILVPPGVAHPDARRHEFAVVADTPHGSGVCPVQEEAIRIQPLDKKIRVIVDRDLLAQQRRPGWLLDWGASLESRQCVAAGAGDRLAHAVVESVPLDPRVAYGLLNKPFLTGYVELGPGHRLEVRSPIMSGGTSADAAPEIAAVTAAGNGLDVELKMPGLIGYEIAWYGIRPREAEPGYRFAPFPVRRYIEGVSESAPGPAIDYFHFSPQAAYFRLFYKTDENGVTAMVVAGADRDDLERRTNLVGTDLAVCREQSGMCIALPSQVGVNPFIWLRVNGSETTAPLGATVAAAIQAAGEKNPSALLPRLTVAKLFGGKRTPVEFDRHSGGILTLPLFGGEEIAWLSDPQ